MASEMAPPSPTPQPSAGKDTDKEEEEKKSAPGPAADMGSPAQEESGSQEKQDPKEELMRILLEISQSTTSFSDVTDKFSSKGSSKDLDSGSDKDADPMEAAPGGNPMEAMSGGNPLEAVSGGNPLEAASGGNPMSMMSAGPDTISAPTDILSGPGSAMGGGGGGGGAPGPSPDPTAAFDSVAGGSNSSLISKGVETVAENPELIALAL